MNFFRQSDYIPAVSNSYRRSLANRDEAELILSAHESLRAMRRISSDLLQKAVQDLVNEQASALRGDRLF